MVSCALAISLGWLGDHIIPPSLQPYFVGSWAGAVSVFLYLKYVTRVRRPASVFELRMELYKFSASILTAIAEKGSRGEEISNRDVLDFMGEYIDTNFPDPTQGGI